MRALILSDSHGKVTDVKAAIIQAGDFDVLVHLGDIECSKSAITSLVDCPTYIVAGNCDRYSDLPAYASFEFGDKKIFASHGHNYYIDLGPQRYELFAEENGFDVALFGHTHRPFYDKGERVTLFNPGSISYPRTEDRKRTFGIMELDDKGELHFNIAEALPTFKVLEEYESLKAEGEYDNEKDIASGAIKRLLKILRNH